MTDAEKKNRNKAILSGFGELYREMRERYGSANFTGIYHALGKQFSLSVMQVRRIVKGY